MVSKVLAVKFSKRNSYFLSFQAWHTNALQRPKIVVGIISSLKLSSVILNLLFHFLFVIHFR